MENRQANSLPDDYVGNASITKSQGEILEARQPEGALAVEKAVNYYQ